MRFIGFLFLVLFLASCSSLRNTPKHELVDGVYKLDGNKVIVENSEDTIRIFSNEDTETELYNLPYSSSSNQKSVFFHKSTLDFDLMSVPIKIRKSTNGIPTQLFTEIDASVYIGRRSDLFYIKYKKTPRNSFKQEIDHFGFSMGGFLGFGSTSIHSGVSYLPIHTDYQGIIFSKGFAGILAFNDFTLGIVYGFDQLLDENASSWIYNQKPYFGLAFGLNLN
ncbi:hypothetical protein [Aquirufa aurantiipilula]|uniref:Lipoprotein n=1 Tax=Aquirufa aurantiipilula TaxID=2696561 RepID=A0ABT6BMK0_9BACT|nr:hypothetical protein [Aquirufa aurantiipilula]MDF5691563.1 hypothetical protein [Aquirufa aurantiipilula]